MKKQTALKIFSAALAVLMSTALIGCGSKNSTVSTDGSTSMEKVIGSLGEAFAQKYDIEVTYNPTGSGSGITAVSEGRCDIGLSSRLLKDEEKAEGLTETVLAYDAIAIIVNPENPVTELTLEQLAAIYRGEITNWKDVGGDDREIVVIGREAGSGTRSGFESAVGVEGSCTYRQELTSAGDVVTTVSQNVNAIGYASLAAVKNTAKIVAIDGAMPDESTVTDGSYAVQCTFIMVTREDTELSAEAQKFFDYAVSAEAREIIAAAGVIAAN